MHKASKSLQTQVSAYPGEVLEVTEGANLGDRFSVSVTFVWAMPMSFVTTVCPCPCNEASFGLPKPSQGTWLWTVPLP